jgi:hypothetical protein
MQILKQIDKQTEIMKQKGPQEITYASLFEAKDIPLIQKFMKLKTRENPPQVIEFFDKCEQKWNDHNPTINGVEFLQVSRADDIPTIQGLAYSNKIVITGGVLWRYMGVGSDSREARCYQQRLYAETEPRADMTQAPQGSMTRVNQSMRFIGIFPASFPTITVRESGVFNVVTAYTGTQLNRNMFSSTPITHTVGISGFTIGSLINFIPVTTWG